MSKIEYRLKRIWKVVPIAVLCIGVMLACERGDDPPNKKITKKNVKFIKFSGFPGGTSIWDDIGYNSTYNKVFVAVTNHKNEQMLYAYDVKSKKFEKKGIITKMAHLKGLRENLTGLGSYQHQGKVHTKFIEGPKGNMFFGTDGGASREEYFMNHPRGYQGGYFMKWNPGTQKMTNLGKALMFDSIKDVDIDPKTGTLYGISYPQAHFIVYNPKKNTRRDLGRLNSGYVPRVMFTDKWGNGYYVGYRQRLIKYDKQKKALIFAGESLPAFSNTPGSSFQKGLVTYAKDPADGIIYFVTYIGRLFALHPKKEGIGKVEDLGGVIDSADLGSDIPPWRAYTPNMAFGKNGKLYYFVGSEGRYAQKGKVLLVEYDPKSKKKRILLKYPTSKIAVATGSNTTDKQGNMYFGAFKRVKKNGHSRDVPFMIKFNPTKKLQ
jgi:hypothetical protein